MGHGSGRQLLDARSTHAPGHVPPATRSLGLRASALLRHCLCTTQPEPQHLRPPLPTLLSGRVRPDPDLLQLLLKRQSHLGEEVGRVGGVSGVV